MSFRTTKRRYQIKVQFFLRISIKTNVASYTVSTLREKEFAQTPFSLSFSLSFCSPAELGTRCCYQFYNPRCHHYLRFHRRRRREKDVPLRA